MPEWVALAFPITAGVVAALVGAVVGARRGLRSAEDRVDKETAALIRVLQERLTLVEAGARDKDATIAAQNATIATLTTRVTTLESELRSEQRITRRLVAGQEGTT